MCLVPGQSNLALKRDTVDTRQKSLISTKRVCGQSDVFQDQDDNGKYRQGHKKNPNPSTNEHVPYRNTAKYQDANRSRHHRMISILAD